MNTFFFPTLPVHSVWRAIATRSENLQIIMWLREEKRGPNFLSLCGEKTTASGEVKTHKLCISHLLSQLRGNSCAHVHTYIHLCMHAHMTCASQTVDDALASRLADICVRQHLINSRTSTCIQQNCTYVQANPVPGWLGARPTSWLQWPLCYIGDICQGAVAHWRHLYLARVLAQKAKNTAL